MVLVQWLSFTHTITIQIKLIKSTIYFSFDGKVGIRLNTLTKLSYTIPSVAQLQLVARQLQHKPFPQNPNFAVRLVGLQEQSAIDNIVATTITKVDVKSGNNYNNSIGAIPLIIASITIATKRLKFFSSSTTLVVALKTLSHVINLMPQQN